MNQTAKGHRSFNLSGTPELLRDLGGGGGGTVSESILGGKHKTLF